MKIAILCSGALGMEVLKELAERYNSFVVLTDKKSLTIIDFCAVHSIPLFVGNPRNGKGYSFLRNYEIDILVSINYLFLIESDIISHAKKMAFNIHGSLLPKYRGRTPHVWAIINNEKETGITAHKIDNGCDTGDIISQLVIPIDFSDTGNGVLQKFNNAYKTMVFDVLKQIELNTYSLTAQDHSIATYFGKRTPDDGQINWNWQKERIYNWVRAQASPYPGAFTFYEGEKIIIDKIEFANTGFDYDMPNGLIIGTNPLLVKTPNGVILVKDYREEVSFKAKTQFE